MPVPDQTPTITHVANGLSTSFAFDFLVFNVDDLQVSIAGVRQTSGYTVSGLNADRGGEVVFLTPPLNGSQVLLMRVLPLNRATSYQNNGDLLAATINTDFDRRVMVDQQLQEQLSRAVMVPEGSDTDPAELIAELKADADRAEAAREGAEEIADKFGDVDAAITETKAARDIAVDAADSASADRERAEAAADSASAARDIAVDAAESAAIDAMTFDSILLGIAGTSHGDYFRVWRPSATGLSFIYYRNDNGAATELTDYPSAGAVDNMQVEINFLDEKVRNALTATNVMDNELDLIFFVVDSNKKLLSGLKADGSIYNPQLNAELDELKNITSDALRVKNVMGNDLDIVLAYVDENKRFVYGVDGNGGLVNSALDKLSDRIATLECGTGGVSRTLCLVILYGQSNATGSVSMSQTWRWPVGAWNVYPEGYDGPLDGDAFITNAGVGVLTLNDSLSDFIPMTNKTFGVNAGEGPMHGAMDPIKAVYPERNMITFGHGLGSASIEMLDRPTPTEILAGDASGISIPITSTERRMLDDGVGFGAITNYSYVDCATPYYRGIYAATRIKEIAQSAGYAVKVDAMHWMQGETGGKDDPNYADKLIAFYDQYAADMNAVFSQCLLFPMFIEMTNYRSCIQ